MAIAPEMEGSASIACSRNDRDLIVEVRGELDASTAPVFVSRVEIELELDPRSLVVDLSGVTFCGSAGIGALIRLRKICSGRGTRLILRRPSSAVTRVFRIAAVEHYFVIEP